MRFSNRIFTSIAVLACASLFPVVALAQLDAGGIADGLSSQTTQVAKLVTVVAFVIGVGLAIAGLLKFRANAQNPNDPSNSMTTAFVLVFVGAAMVAIPSLLGSGIMTIFGSTDGTTDATNGFNSLN